MILLPHQLKEQIQEIQEKYYYTSLKSLKGNILEIGFGNGSSFECYSNECNVYAIEKNNRLLTDRNGIQGKINIRKGTAEHLPFKSELFDAVVFSFLLCSVSSIEGSIKEIRRVLKKGGKVIFLEHVKSNNKITYAFQKVLTSVQILFNDCRFDRDPREIIKEYKFKIIIEKYFDNVYEPYLFMELIKR